MPLQENLMKSTRLIALSLIAIALAVSSASAADGPACDIHLSVSDRAGGHAVTLANPSITVREGQPASISVATGGTTYSFDVLVTSEKGRLIANTKAKITKGQQLITAQQITSIVGEPASMTAGTLTVAVDAQLAKAGA
jgi:hypothetical protein